jgi:hypothetical protein
VNEFSAPRSRRARVALAAVLGLVAAGAVGALFASGYASGAKGRAAAAEYEYRTHGIHLHVHGVLEPGALAIEVDAAGPGSDLGGAGWANPAGGGEVAAKVKEARYFTQTGTFVGDQLRLQGTVLFSNKGAFRGGDVTTEANLATRQITWTFDPRGPEGPFVYTGTGTVAIIP